MAIIINKDRAREVFGVLVEAYRVRQYPFSLPGAIPPQVRSNIPAAISWGSREHALFLFALCYWMRGGIESDTATVALGELYEAAPWIFLPEHVKGISPALLAMIFRSVGLGFNAAQTTELWKRNFARILRLWKGDPRNIFSGVSTYEEACARIQNRKGKGFGGFQEKMVSMLIYFYMDADIIDQWNFPIPVDFHVCRNVFAHEILRADEKDMSAEGFYTKPILAEIRTLCKEYCATHNVNPLVLCEALWIFSRISCSKHPGNQSVVAKKRKGRSTEIFPMPRWTSAQARTYGRICGSCPVRETCQWHIPAAEYYIGGKIVLRERHDAPPQQSLSFHASQRELATTIEP